MEKSNLRVFFENEAETDKSLGCEINRRRLSKNQTLAFLADDICSLSYISKIENNKLDPSKEVLQQVCMKLDMSQAEINNLYKTSDILSDMMRFYLDENHSLIEKSYEKVQYLSNFRAELIRLVYYVDSNKQALALKTIDLLKKLIHKFNVYDEAVFHTMHGIVYFLSGSHENAIYILKNVVNHIGNVEVVFEIALYYLCEGYFRINSYKFLSYNSLCIQLLYKLNNFKRATRLKKINFLYYYNKNQSDEIIKSYKLLNQEESIDETALYNLYIDNKDFMLSDNFKCINEYIKLLYIYHYNNEEYSKELEKADTSKIGVVECIHLTALNYKLKYQLSDMEIFYRYLEQTAFPYSISILDVKNATIYGEQLITNYSSKMQYKKAYQISENLRLMLNKIDKI